MLIAEAIAVKRVAELLSQRSQGHIRALGDEQQIACYRGGNLSGGRCPEAADHPQQRGLATSGRPHHEQALTAGNAQIEILGQQAISEGGLHSSAFEHNRIGRGDFRKEIAVFRPIHVRDI